MYLKNFTKVFMLNSSFKLAEAVLNKLLYIYAFIKIFSILYFAFILLGQYYELLYTHTVYIF